MVSAKAKGEIPRLREGIKMASKWFEKSYRRSLVDMHIPDWDERFLSEFDSKEYVRLMKLACVDSLYIYATSCVGLANFPAKAGNMHKGLKGKDIIKEITESGREQGMNVIVYYNIWSKWAYDNHPEWRVVNARGQGTADYMWDQPGRYGVCCFNSPYRDFVKEQIEELCENYAFDGLWIDMILLPQTICYCSSCRKRYYEETGCSELPRTINWENPDFVAFQRRREVWLNDFTSLLKNTVNRRKPEASVAYNVSSYSAGWQLGGNVEFFNLNDYLSGDVSGEPLTVTYTCKLFYSASPAHSVEFMTSVADSNLLEHTILKSKEYLRAKLFLTIAHNGSFGFIDAIDPAGTLNERTYRLMGELFNELKPYEAYLDADAEFCQDVGIYTNFESLIDLKENGTRAEDVKVAESPHYMASVSAAKSFIHANIPFGVINKCSLSQIDKYQVIVLPDVVVMDEREIEAFRVYVEKGGRLYASADTSLLDANGNRRSNFMLSEVLGVTFIGRTPENITYTAPTESGRSLLPDYSQKYPMTLQSGQKLIQADGTSEVLATIVLPDIDPDNVHRFSSAISSPPEIVTAYPAIVSNTYGSGRTVYAAGPIEAMEKEAQRSCFVSLVQELMDKPAWFESDAPKSVELTLFHQAKNNRFILNAVNFQKELPNIPVDRIRLRVKLEHRKPSEVSLLPNREPIPYHYDGQYVEFRLPRLETFHMVAVHYTQ